ncbi:MAG: hypothetical protein OXC40_05120, partial [Proteobacteria bacterium]|nr:hypothetical protein [Pseudomonadota bacterium]
MVPYWLKRDKILTYFYNFAMINEDIMQLFSPFILATGLVCILSYSAVSYSYPLNDERPDPSMVNLDKITLINGHTVHQQSLTDGELNLIMAELYKNFFFYPLLSESIADISHELEKLDQENGLILVH